jgi:hypothetical protein
MNLRATDEEWQNDIGSGSKNLVAKVSSARKTTCSITAHASPERKKHRKASSSRLGLTPRLANYTRCLKNGLRCAKTSSRFIHSFSSCATHTTSFSPRLRPGSRPVSSPHATPLTYSSRMRRFARAGQWCTATAPTYAYKWHALTFPLLSSHTLTPNPALPPLEPTHRSLKPRNREANAKRLRLHDHARGCHYGLPTWYIHLRDTEHDGV